MEHRIRQWCVTVLGLSAALIIGTVQRGWADAAADNDVVSVSRSFSDGGKYDKDFKGTGTPEEIRFGGKKILSQGDGTYCSGFTFAVVMRVATKRGLLAHKTVEQIRTQQQEWYGATEASKEHQCVKAMEDLGIGTEVKMDDGLAGDFVQFFRVPAGFENGHSAIFLGWVEQGGKRVGVRYRSSQGSTGGIGDHEEYFKDVPGKTGTIVRGRCYFGRLKS